MKRILQYFLWLSVLCAYSDIQVTQPKTQPNEIIEPDYIQNPILPTGNPIVDLNMAIQWNDLNRLNFILNAYPSTVINNIKYLDDKNNTPLHQAIHHMNDQIFARLLHIYPHLINEPNKINLTPMSTVLYSLLYRTDIINDLQQALHEQLKNQTLHDLRPVKEALLDIQTKLHNLDDESAQNAQAALHVLSDINQDVEITEILHVLFMLEESIYTLLLSITDIILSAKQLDLTDLIRVCFEERPSRNDLSQALHKITVTQNSDMMPYLTIAIDITDRIMPHIENIIHRVANAPNYQENLHKIKDLLLKRSAISTLEDERIQAWMHDAGNKAYEKHLEATGEESQNDHPIFQYIWKQDLVPFINILIDQENPFDIETISTHHFKTPLQFATELYFSVISHPFTTKDHPAILKIMIDLLLEVGANPDLKVYNHQENESAYEIYPQLFANTHHDDETTSVISSDPAEEENNHKTTESDSDYESISDIEFEVSLHDTDEVK